MTDLTNRISRDEVRIIPHSIALKGSPVDGSDGEGGNLLLGIRDGDPRIVLRRGGEVVFEAGDDSHD